MHPHDGRPVFAYPWEGATLVGTTDLDHAQPMDAGGAHHAGRTRLPAGGAAGAVPAARHLARRRAVATYAGVRPVIAGGHADASREGREHSVWSEDGLVAVAGGKLTTFRAIALDALKQVRAQLPEWRDALRAAAGCSRRRRPPATRACRRLLRRLQGRTAHAAGALLARPREGELRTHPRHRNPVGRAALGRAREAVQRLDDLLLRRTRLGLQLRGGGAALMPRIRAICQPELGWRRRAGSANRTPIGLWRSHYRPAARGDRMRMQPTILAIDNGTQSVRALLFDLQGNIVAKSQVMLEAYFSTQPGWAEHDPEDTGRRCARPARACGASPACTRRRAGRGRHHPARHRGQPGQGRQAAAPGHHLARPAPHRRRAAIAWWWRAAFKLARVDGTIDYFRGEAEINWIKAHQPDIWAATDKFLLLSGYLNWRLCGRFADSSGSQVAYLPFDYKRRRWAARATGSGRRWRSSRTCCPSWWSRASSSARSSAAGGAAPASRKARRCWPRPPTRPAK
jgi:hypothetical protein